MTNPQRRQQVGLLLLHLYELMGDMTMGVGVLRGIIVPQKPLFGAYYELLEDWKNAVSSYSQVDAGPLQSWARSRVEVCRKNQRMWYMLSEQAREENDIHLGCESHAHLNDWM